MVEQAEQPPSRGRRRRRAVGPPGAVTAPDSALDLARDALQDPPDDDVERLTRDRPPHHDRGV